MITNTINTCVLSFTPFTMYSFYDYANGWAVQEWTFATPVCASTTRIEFFGSTSGTTYNLATPVVATYDASVKDSWNFITQSTQNGPGAFFIYSLFDAVSAAPPVANVSFYIFPDAITFANMTSTTTFVIRGEVIQPGAYVTFWRPGVSTCPTCVSASAPYPYNNANGWQIDVIDALGNVTTTNMNLSGKSPNQLNLLGATSVNYIYFGGPADYAYNGMIGQDDVDNIAEILAAPTASPTPITNPLPVVYGLADVGGLPSPPWPSSTTGAITLSVYNALAVPVTLAVQGKTFSITSGTAQTLVLALPTTIQPVGTVSTGAASAVIPPPLNVNTQPGGGFQTWPLLYVFGTAPPPLIVYAGDGSFFTATTVWGANATTINNVNVIVRAVPTIRLYANGLLTQAAQTPSVAYLGNAASGKTQSVQFIGNGPSVVLTPTDQNDVIILELQTAETKCSAGPVSAIFDALRIKDILAARPLSPPPTQWNMLQNGIQLTKYTAIVGDNGAEITIIVGNTAVFNCVSQLPHDFCPVAGASSPTASKNITVLELPYALPLSNICPSTEQYVAAVCGTPGFTQCSSVFGATPSTCIGRYSNTVSAGGVDGTLGGNCYTACQLDDYATATACRAVIDARCADGSGSADPDARPECACARYSTSKVPVNLIAGQPQTFPQFTQWFQQNYKGGGVPLMLQQLQCWWPACTQADGALAVKQPCPTVVQECFALVSNVAVTNDSKLRISLKNACGIDQDTNSHTQPVAAPSLPKPPAASSQVVGIITTAVVGFLLMVCAMAVGGTTGSAARRRR